MYRVALGVDHEPFLRALNQLSAAVAALQQRMSEPDLDTATELTLDLLQRLFSLPDFPQMLVQGLSEGFTTCTEKAVLSLQPSIGFELLLAATRAGDLDLTVIERAFGQHVRYLLESGTHRIAEGGRVAQ